MQAAETKTKTKFVAIKTELS